MKKNVAFLTLAVASAVTICAPGIALSSPACTTPPAGLVSWWRAEGNGNDSFGTNNASVPAGVAYVASEVGLGFDLEGNTNRIMAPDAPELNFNTNQNFSIEAWIQPLSNPGNYTDSSGEIMTIVSKRYNPNLVTALGYEMFLASGRLSLQMDDVLNDYHNYNAGPDLRDGNFHHVAITVQRNFTNGIVFYVDGQKIATFDPTVTPGDLSNTDPLRIGNHPMPGLAAFYHGIIDEVSLYNRSLTASEVASIYNAGTVGKCTTSSTGSGCTQAPAGLLGWWKADGNATDTVSGSTGNLVNCGYTNGTVGQAFSFDPENFPWGTYTGVQIPDQPAYVLTNSLTIETWIRPRGDGYTVFFRGDNRPGLDPYGLGFQGNHDLWFVISDANNNAAHVDALIPYNVWTHVAAILDGNTGLMSLYTNGVLATQSNTTIRPFGQLVAADSPGVGIGNVNDGFNNFGYYGDIDEVSLYGRALTVSEVQAIYSAGSAGKCTSGGTSSLCVAPAPGIAGWWKGDDNGADSIHGQNGLLENGITFAAGEVGQAFRFTTTNDDVRIPANTFVNVGLSNGFTLETWVAPSDLSGERPLFEWNTGVGSWGVHFHLSQDAGPGSLYANIVDNSGYWHQIHTTTAPVVTNVFAHVALTYDKSSGLATIYANGTVVAQQNLGSFTPQTSYDLYLGRRPLTTGEAYSFLGLMDEPAIYNRALSASEIQAIYNAGSAGKCTASSNCVTFSNFNSVAGLTLTGSTTVTTNGVLRLTPATASQTGDVWLTGKTPCAGGFDTTFHFRITQLGNIYGNEPGGDGFTFSVQNESQTNNAWAMGDTNNYVSVFFNTFWNWPGCVCPDVSDNSVGILINQSYLTQTDLNPLGINMSDGNVHSCRVRFDGSTMTVWVDSQMVLTNVSVPGLQPGVDSNGNGWMGFTAGTGGAYENHDILDWSLCAQAGPVNTNSPSGPPTIYNFSPDRGSNGTLVAIVGTNFSPVTASNTVYFGAVRATVLSATSSSLIAIVPAGATYAPLTVTVGGLTAISGKLFEPTFNGNGSNLTTSSFATSFNLGTGGQPGACVIGDFDGDGKPDIALVSGDAHVVSIFRNISTNNAPLSAASFAPRVDLTFAAGGTSGNPYKLCAADLDGDGKLDLIATEVGGNRVSVFHNVATPGTLTTSSFAPSFALVTGSDCRFAAAADLDGDGHLDLVALNYGDKTVSIFKNIGTSGSLTAGSFAAPVTLADPAGPYEVVIADLDGDGRPDLAIGNVDNTTISIFQNLASTGVLNTNSFAPRLDLPAEDGNQGMAVADLDGDGKLDLICGSFRTETISVYRNLGSAGLITSNSFAPHVDFPSGNWSFTVAVGDLNGDGKPDISEVGQLPSTLSLFQNISTPGSFTTASLATRVDLGAGWNAAGVAVGDLDGDGRPDVVFCNIYDSNIQIYQNATPFGAPATVTNPPVISSVLPNSGSIGANITIAGTNFSSTAANNIVYFGAVKATVTSASATSLTVTVPAGATFAPVTVTVNGLTAWANAPFLPTFTSGTNSLALAPRLDLPAGDGSGQALIGDVDGDGLPDLLVNSGSPRFMSIYQNLGDSSLITSNSFAPRTDVPLPGQIQNGALADVDGDGKLDLVVLDRDLNQVHILKNVSTTGNITSNAFVSVLNLSTGNDPRGIVVRDLDGDGLPDVAVANWADGTVSVFRNLGTSGGINTNSFAAPVVFTVGPNAQDLKAADLDGDGKPDLVTANNNYGTTNSVSLLRNTSTPGTISFAPQVALAGLPTAYCLAIGDMDGDGQLDVVVSSFDQGQSVSVYRNVSSPGNLAFAPNVDFAAGGWGNGVAIGDLDGDEKPDLAVVTQLPDHVSIFKNISTPGSFNVSSLAARQDYPTGWNPNGVAIGDLDGDGRPDIAFAVGYGATVSIYQNQTTAMPAQNLLANGGFENPPGIYPYQVFDSGNPMPGWTVESGTVEITAGTYWQAPEGAQSLDLNGIYDQIGTIYQDFATVPGQNYKVRFAYAGNPECGTPTLKTANVYWSGTLLTNLSFDITGHSVTNMGWIYYQQIVTATSTNSRIRFQATSPTFCGLTLDDVSVTPTSALMPPLVVSQPTNLTVTVNGPAMLSVVAAGTQPLTYQWYFNGTNLPYATSSVLLLSNVQPAQAGNYFVTVSNLAGSVTSSNALLTVYVPQIPPAIVSQSGNQIVLVGNTAVFGVTVTGSTPLSYQWSRNGAPMPNETNATYTIANAQLTDSGSKFSCFVTNLYGTASSTNVSLKVLDTVFNDLCSGAVIITNASYTNVQSTLKASAFGDPMPSCVDGFGHGVWYEFTAPVAGLLVVDTFGSDFDTGLAIYTGTCDALTQVACDDDTGGVGVTSQISLPTTAGTTYFILAGGYQSDAGNLVLHLNHFTPPAFDVWPTNLSVVVSSNAVFNPTVSGTQPISYQWFFNNTPLSDGGRISGSTNSNLIIVNVQTNDGGNYQLVASNFVGVTTSSVAVLTPIILPPTITTPPVTQAVPQGSNVTFFAVVDGTPPYSYQWLFDGTPLTDDGVHVVGATTSTLNISNLATLDAGSYTLIVTNLSGSDNASATLIVMTPPVITAAPVGRSVPPGLPTTFNVAASGIPAPYYRWQLNGTNLTDWSFTNALTLPAVGTNDLGFYQVVAQNSVGSVTSGVAQLTFGPVAAWGMNTYGESLPPPGLSNVSAVAGAYLGSFAVLGNGNVTSWGKSPTSTNVPTVPAQATNVVAISTSFDGLDAAVLRADGTIFSWPAAAVSSLNNIVSISIGSSFGLAVRAEGTVTNWNTLPFVLTIPAGLNHVTDVACGFNHALALRNDGTVVAWGTGVATNVPSGLTNVAAIAAGYSHSLALKSNGVVVAWGSGRGTNLPPGLTNIIAISASRYLSGQALDLALRANGTVVAWGDNSYGETNPPPALANLLTVAIAAAPNHGLALVNDGSPQILRSPVGLTAYTGRDVTLRATATGAAPLSYQWLFNGTNVPGATNTTLPLPNLQFANAGSYQLFVSNAVGTALSLSAPLTVISNNALTFLTQSSVSSSNVYQGSKATFYGGAVLGNGPLRYQWFWSPTNRNYTAVPGATNDTLVLDPAFAWQSGNYYLSVSNGYFQPPYQAYAITSAPVGVRILFARAWGYNAVTNPPINVTNAVAIATGGSPGSTTPLYGGGDYFAVGADGKVTTWANYFPTYGETNLSALSNSFVTAIAATAQHTLALKSDGTVYAWGLGYYGQTNVPAGLNGVVAIACGGYHDLALKSDGTVVGWGASLQAPNYGQATNNPAATNVVAIAAGNQHSLVLRADGSAVAWGYSFDGAVNIPPTATNLVAIAAGSGFSAGLRANGTVVQWGNAMLSYPVPATLSNVVAISASGTHCTALKNDGTVVSWGIEYNVPASNNVPADLANVAAITSGGDHDFALLGTRAPIFTVQPWNRSLVLPSIGATNLVLAAKCVGVQPMSYQWRLNGTNYPGATNDTLTLRYDAPLQGTSRIQPGAYQLVASNSYGVTISKPAKVTIVIPLGFALNATNLNWISTNSAPWYGQTNYTHDGVAAARSGGIGASQETVLQTTLATNVAGTVSFWWKVSSEQFFDSLEFRVNGNVQTNISGEVDWQQASIFLPAGTNVLQWRYSKDPSFDSGLDAGFVDQFAFTSAPKILSQPVSVNANAGATVNLAVAASGVPQLGYQWAQNGNPVGGNSPVLTITNVCRAQDGVYCVTVTNAGGAAVSSNAVVHVNVPQLLGTPALAADGSLQFTSSDINGGTLTDADLPNFEAQASTDLVTWVTLPNALTINNGKLQLSDASRTNYPARYYRIVEH